MQRQYRTVQQGRQWAVERYVERSGTWHALPRHFATRTEAERDIADRCRFFGQVDGFLDAGGGAMVRALMGRPARR